MKPRKAVYLCVQNDAININGLALLRLVYTTPTGKREEMLLEIDVDNVKCARRTINRVCAKFKELAQAMAESL